MSVINETEIEQLYLARYDPLLQLNPEKSNNYGSFFKDDSTILENGSEWKKRDKRAALHTSFSQSSLTSWKNQRIQSRLNDGEAEGTNSFCHVPSVVHQSDNSSPKGPSTPSLKHFFFVNTEHEDVRHHFEDSSKLQSQNNNPRHSVKDVVNVWPPRTLSQSHEKEDTTTPRTESPPSYVKDVLKKVYEESTTISVMSTDGQTASKETHHLERSPSLLKIATHNNSSHKISRESSTPLPSPKDVSELSSLFHTPIQVKELPEPEEHELSESPKDPRRFIKNIGPSSPVGLLALVTRELSQNIDPSKFLKSPKDRASRKGNSTNAAKEHKESEKSSLRRNKHFRNALQKSRKSDSSSTEEDIRKDSLGMVKETCSPEASLLRSRKHADRRSKRRKSEKRKMLSSKVRNLKKTSSSERKSQSNLEERKDNNSPRPKPETKPEELSPDKTCPEAESDEKFWTFTTSVVIPKTNGIPDHLERDSLDGNLPGSSHGTSSGGNPPPPPAPPTSSTNTSTANNANNNNNNSSIGSNNNVPNDNSEAVNNNPEGLSAPTPSFSKGPNAKSKKPKRLKSDNGTLDFPARQNESTKKRPSYDALKNRDVESGGYRSKTEPYTYLWVVLSRMYGKLIVLLMLAFCLTEVLDNKIAPLTFQEVFLLYLYVGSIIAIMCIYVTVIIDNCPSITASKENLTKPGDPEAGSISSFGTLKRAHISRSKTSRTSFYLRVGALVFGLGTLIYNGLEIAMHSSIPEGCVSDTILAHPIMQALFTFLQMHFLFVNSEVIVEKFGQIARFGFMHLVATNLALWVRMVVWESANDSMAVIKREEAFGSTFSPTALGFHSLELQRLSRCYQNNTLGQLWNDSQQYLFPFLVQYSLIAASVTYIMWCNVGKERLSKLGSYSKALAESTNDKRNKGHWKVDCRSASKGLFLGLLVLVGGTVILIIFFVMKDQEDFKLNLFWMCNGTMMIIFSLCIAATIFGFIQIPKLSISTTQPLALDRLLLSTTVVGVYIFAIFGMIVGGIDYHSPEKLATFCSNMLLLIQVSLQGMLVAEASRRTCTNRFQMVTKPGRQVITFLLFSNVTLWVLDTFMTHNSITNQFQIDFYGKVVWGVISRISLPLMILFRFHSAVILVEIWKNTYRTKSD